MKDKEAGRRDSPNELDTNNIHIPNPIKLWKLHHEIVVMGWINSVGISDHTMRLLMVKFGRNISYDDQLQSEVRGC